MEKGAALIFAGWSEIFEVLQQTFIQSFISAIFAFTFGFLGALGLISVGSRSRRWVEFFILLPNLLPTLFLIVASLQMITIFFPFPFNIKGVILVHVLMNTGLVAVAAARLIETKMGRMLELATVEGASHFQLVRVTIGYLRKEFFYLGFFVFAVCFTSFSVPLIVGGDSGQTLEVSIYRMVLSEGNLRIAFFLSFLQFVFIAAMSFWLKSVHPAPRASRAYYGRLQNTWYMIVLLILTGGLLLASLIDLPVAWSQMQANEELKSRLGEGLLGTLLECLGVMIFIFIGLIVAAYMFPHRLLHRLLLACSAPSTVLIGLVIYLIYDSTGQGNVLTIFVMSAAFALVVFPVLYRLKGAETLLALDRQIQVARTLGASRKEIFRFIVLPQSWRDFLFLAGIGAFWASGDFALSSMIAGRDLTLAMSAHTLLGGYRIELASLVTWMSMIVGGAIYFVCDRIVRVHR